jgi:hypothetical protein
LVCRRRCPSARRRCHGRNGVANRCGGGDRRLGCPLRHSIGRRRAFYTFSNRPVCRQSLADLARFAFGLIAWRVTPLIVALIVTALIGRPVGTIAAALLILPSIAPAFLVPAVVSRFAARLVATVAAIPVGIVGAVAEPVLILIPVLILVTVLVLVAVLILIPILAGLPVLARLAVIAPVAAILTVSIIPRLLILLPPGVTTTLILVAVLRGVSIPTGIKVTSVLATGLRGVVAILVALIVFLGPIGTQAARRLTRRVTRLLQLLAIRHDDAIVMLGVLEIILSQHRIAGRLRVARECQIFLGNMRRRAANFYVRAVRLETARQRVLLMLPVAIVALMIVVAIIIWPTATAAILLTLPHCRYGSCFVWLCLVKYLVQVPRCAVIAHGKRRNPFP